MVSPILDIRSWQPLSSKNTSLAKSAPSACDLGIVVDSLISTSLMCRKRHQK